MDRPKEIFISADTPEKTILWGVWAPTSDEYFPVRYVHESEVERLQLQLEANRDALKDAIADCTANYDDAQGLRATLERVREWRNTRTASLHDDFPGAAAELDAILIRGRKGGNDE